MQKLVEVAFPIPTDSTFTYDLSENHFQPQIGHRVLAPFGRRTITGYVVGHPTDSKNVETKPIQAVLDDTPVLTEALVDLARFMARRYFVSFGEALQILLPPGLTRQSRQRVVAIDRPGDPEEQKLSKLLGRIRKTGSRGLDRIHLIRKDPSHALVINKLATDGWIKVENLMRVERARGAKTKFYVLTEAGSNVDLAQLRGEKQRKVLEELRKNSGTIQLNKLRDQFGNVSTVLSRLQAMNLIREEESDSNRPILVDDAFRQTCDPLDLNEDQQKAESFINEAVDQNRFKEILLFGVTGSGKTEIYLRITANVLKKRQTVLALVPEISLTPQFVGRFQSRFQQQVAILHSGLSESERYGEWQRIRSGEAKIVVGARSAVFSPLENLGLIIFDEEHDPSYKQGDSLLYHAKDIARFRAQANHTLILYGSATPALETFHRCHQKSIDMVSLPSRAKASAMPAVEIIDLRSELSGFGEKGIFSKRLSEEIAETLTAGRQAVLFLNRRGFAPIVLCPRCGESLKCKNCSVSLIFHRRENAFLCHYCGFQRAEGEECEKCKGEKFVFLGLGTERVEQELHNLFPDARIDRMDRDSVRNRKQHESVLRRLALGQTDILIGTQMVTKGMDFDNVSLVGVLLADHGLHFPDFRAAERTFQMLTQVIGRAGRGAYAGKAVIQTFQPEHYAIRFAADQNYMGFFDHEIDFRRQSGYPPFCKAHLFEWSGTQEKDLAQLMSWVGVQARKALEDASTKVRILGPTKAPIFRVKGKCRYQMLLLGESETLLHRFSGWFREQVTPIGKQRKIKLRLDMDPYSFL